MFSRMSTQPAPATLSTAALMSGDSRRRDRADDAAERDAGVEDLRRVDLEAQPQPRRAARLERVDQRAGDRGRSGGCCRGSPRGRSTGTARSTAGGRRRRRAPSSRAVVTTDALPQCHRVTASVSGQSASVSHVAPVRELAVVVDAATGAAERRILRGADRAATVRDEVDRDDAKPAAASCGRERRAPSPSSAEAVTEDDDRPAARRPVPAGIAMSVSRIERRLLLGVTDRSTGPAAAWRRERVRQLRLVVRRSRSRRRARRRSLRSRRARTRARPSRRTGCSPPASRSRRRRIAAAERELEEALRRIVSPFAVQIAVRGANRTG